MAGVIGWERVAHLNTGYICHPQIIDMCLQFSSLYLNACKLLLRVNSNAAGKQLGPCHGKIC